MEMGATIALRLLTRGLRPHGRRMTATPEYC